jgi:hypothetical protein
VSKETHFRGKRDLLYAGMRKQRSLITFGVSGRRGKSRPVGFGTIEKNIFFLKKIEQRGERADLSDLEQ